MSKIKIPVVGMAHHHWGYLNKNHLQPQTPQRATQKRTCDKTQPVVALTPLRAHPPCCCHCQTLWVVPRPRCLITVPFQESASRSSLCITSYGGYVEQSVSGMVYRRLGQTTAVISDYRGGSGLP